MTAAGAPAQAGHAPQIPRASGWLRACACGAQLWSGHQIVLIDPSGNPLAATGPLYGGRAYNIAWLRAS